MNSEIVLECPSELINNGDVVFGLSSSFLLHILFMRCLIPAPFAALQQQMKRRVLDSTGKKLTMSEKKVFQFVALTEHFLENLKCLLQTHRALSICVLIGPSANNVKEAYILHFNYITDNMDIADHTYTSTLPANLLARLKRQLMHKLIEYHSSDSLKTPSKTNIFIAIECLKLQRPPIMDFSQDYPSDDENNEVSKEQAVAAHFVYKESFKIRERKKGPRPLHIHFNSICPVEEERRNDEAVSTISERLGGVDINVNLDGLEDVEFQYIGAGSGGSGDCEMGGCGDEDQQGQEVGAELMADEDYENEHQDKVEDNHEEEEEEDANVLRTMWLVSRKGIKSLKAESSSCRG